MLTNWTISNTSNVLAFSTRRAGGVSTGKYGEFNINEYCGDDALHVAENRNRLAAALGIAPESIVLPHQVHGMEVRQIGADYFRRSAEERRQLLEGVDAVTTDQEGLCIGVSTADCIPVLLYDEAHHAVAAIHAGWRGTVRRIVQKTLEHMQATYHTEPANLKAVIGPGISREAFEVGNEVYDEFQKEGFDMEAIAELFPATCQTADDSPQKKWHIDLPLCNKNQLKQAGVHDENILQTGVCTYSRCDEYFSARRLGIQSGRIYTGILLKADSGLSPMKN